MSEPVASTSPTLVEDGIYDRWISRKELEGNSALADYLSSF